MVACSLLRPLLLLSGKKGRPFLLFVVLSSLKTLLLLLQIQTLDLSFFVHNHLHQQLVADKGHMSSIQIGLAFEEVRVCKVRHALVLPSFRQEIEVRLLKPHSVTYTSKTAT